MGKKIKFTAWLLMLMLAMVTAFPVRTLAYERINTSAKCSMELSFMREDQPVDGCRVRAYRICEVTDYGKYLFMPAFQDYKVETYGFDQKAWKDLAQTLSAFVEKDKLEPDAQGETENGRCTFKGLGTGLYMVLADEVIKDKDKLSPVPVLISLPSLTESDTWLYDVEGEIKYEVVDLTKKVDISVIKQWKDDKTTHSAVTVQLLLGGQVADTQELSEANSWSYTWKDVDTSKKISLAEVRPRDGYKASISRNGTKYIVTNTPEKEKEKDKGSSSGGSSGGSQGGSGGQSKKLTQTGQLLWPVPILLILGAGMFIYGLGTAYASKAGDD